MYAADDVIRPSGPKGQLSVKIFPSGVNSFHVSSFFIGKFVLLGKSVHLLFCLCAWQGEYIQIDLGVVRQVKHIALQGRPGSSDYVKTFYLRYGDNGLDFNNYGENATVKYKVNRLRFSFT